MILGSGCEKASSFSDAIRNAKDVFDKGKQLGFEMTILDLGGGFPGTTNVPITLDHIAKAINESLDTYFPEFDELGVESNISVIAEPGRYYVASAFTLATQIIAKRNVIDELDKNDGMMYYLNDGVYGSFNCTIFDHVDVDPVPFQNEHELEGRKSYPTILWGPTCDSMDCIKKNVNLPEMNIGEWFLFKEMGAYTIAAASTFNGFQLPNLKYHIPAHSVETLRNLPSWVRLCEVLGICDADIPTVSNDAFEMDHHMELLIPVH